jgi:hypothetical protein
MKPARRSRFVNETRQVASLYLAEFDDGTVKVGQSDNPRTRLGSLQYAARKRHGIAMVRWHVFAGAGFSGVGIGGNWHHACSLARRMERSCIAHFTSIATVRRPGREFFIGLDFDTAMRHVQDVIRQQARALNNNPGKQD